jgi:DNA-binding NtrC family response regulator
MSIGTILAIDDEQNICRLIQNEFTLEGYEVSMAYNGKEGLRLFEQKKFDVVILDIKLPQLNGMEVLKRIKQKSAATEVVMITGYGDIQSAVNSLKLGARDYLTKPFKLDELLTIVKEAMKDIRGKTLSPSKLTGGASPEPFSGVLCPSPAMQKVYQLAGRVAKTDHTVMLHGETGVGKDILAYHIHQLSLRKGGPFVVVDCGLLSHNLAESELYGHSKGAFSGATEAKVGLVEKSHSGSLFLDEIGNVDAELQKKFLRFLETRQFRRIGETKEQSIDNRIILATNMDLQKAVREGTLRSDLFYRITEFTIVVPPLKDRPEDVLPLARYFLSRSGMANPGIEIAKEAQSLLLDYPWPGNIRELKAVVGKAALMAESNTIQADDLPAHLKSQHPSSSRKSKTIEDIEKEHIVNVLAEMGGNQTKTSEALGINRKTLYKKIIKHKIFS